MPTAEEFPLCNYWPFSQDEKIGIWNVRGELRMRNWFQIQVVLGYVWQSVQCELSEGKYFMLQCTIPNLLLRVKAHPCFPRVSPDSHSWGLEGRAGEERGLFSQRLERHKLGLCQVLLIPATVKCMKVCCFQRASSMFLFLPDLRGVILASAAPWFMSDPMAQSFDLTQPITVPSHALVHFLQSSYLCSSLKWGEEASQ